MDACLTGLRSPMQTIETGKQTAARTEGQKVEIAARSAAALQASATAQTEKSRPMRPSSGSFSIADTVRISDKAATALARTAPQAAHAAVSSKAGPDDAGSPSAKPLDTANANPASALHARAAAKYQAYGAAAPSGSEIATEGGGIKLDD